MMESRDKTFLSELHTFYNDHKNTHKIVKKGVSKHEFDYKVAVVLIYNDGTEKLIGAGTKPYLDLSGYFFEDKDYRFYRLLTKHIKSPTIELFIKSLDK